MYISILALYLLCISGHCHIRREIMALSLRFRADWMRFYRRISPCLAEASIIPVKHCQFYYRFLQLLFISIVILLLLHVEAVV